MTQFTTIKEYDNAVRASQRKLKGLNERLEANPLDGVAQQQKELAQAGHKFLLASRAKFKETGVSSPQLRDVQALALEEGAKLAQGVDLGAGETTGRVIQSVGVPDVVIIDDPISPARQPYAKLKDWAKDVLAGRKPTAAEPQAPTPIDRAREFVPSARVIRERAHAGAMRAHKYAVDDCRAGGLGVRRRHVKGEAWRRTAALAITPKFFGAPPINRGHNSRITVNGQPW